MRSCSPCSTRVSRSGDPLPEGDLLELETRRRIYRHLEEHPGEHMRELGRILAIPMGTLEYHLHQLVKAGLLATREDARFTRYFVAGGGLGRREKDLVAILRQRVPRQIAAFLLLSPDSSHGTILSQFQLSPSTLTFHLKKLMATEVVRQRREGRENRYTVVEPEAVAKVLVTYRATFLDDVVDRFAEAWLALGPPEAPAASSGAGSGEAGESGKESTARDVTKGLVVFLRAAFLRSALG